MSQVGGHHVGPAAGRADLLGDLVELRLCAGGDHHVSTGFRECHRHRSAKAAACSGDYRDLIVEAKPIENHVCLSSPPGDTLARWKAPRMRFLEHVLV